MNELTQLRSALLHNKIWIIDLVELEMRDADSMNETGRFEFDYFYSCLNLLELFPLWKNRQKETTLTN